MHLSLFSLVPAFFLLFLPSPCSAKNLDSVRSFSYVVSGMMAPQSFHVWTTRDGKVMMQVNYKEKKYRRGYRRSKNWAIIFPGTPGYPFRGERGAVFPKKYRLGI